MADSRVHVLPINDLVTHENENCVCGPTEEPVERDDGSMNWLVIHHSLDGRESREPASPCKVVTYEPAKTEVTASG